MFTLTIIKLVIRIRYYC